MASIDTLVCPTDCSAILPTVTFSECAPVLLQAQVSDLYLKNDGNPLINWEDPVEWGTRISNSSTDPTAIRALTVIGSSSAPAVTEKKISHRRTVFSPQEFTLTGNIDDNSDTNYEAARATGCNRNYRFFYATLGGKLYGVPNTGILANLRMWEEVPESEDEYAVIKFQLKWKASFMPSRIDNPIAV